MNSVRTVVLCCCSRHWGYLRLRQATELSAARSLLKMITFLNLYILCKRGYHVDYCVILEYFAPPLYVRCQAFLECSVASPLKVKIPRSNMDRWPLKMDSVRSLESLGNKYPVPEVSILYEHPSYVSDPICSRPVLILSCHVRLCLPTSPSHQVFPQKLVCLSHRSMRAKFLANISVIDRPDNEKYK